MSKILKYYKISKQNEQTYWYLNEENNIILHKEGVIKTSVYKKDKIDNPRYGFKSFDTKEEMEAWCNSPDL